MEFNKKNLRIIIGIIIFAVVFFTVCQNLGTVGEGIGNFIGIFAPFIIGGCMAFIINIPMRFFERKLFPEKRVANRPILGKIKRPVSMILAFLAILIVLALVLLLIIPQLADSIQTIIDEFPGFIKNIQVKMVALGTKYPQIASDLSKISLDMGSISKKIIDYLKTEGMNLLQNTSVAANSVIGAASSVVGGVVNVFIGLIFCFYALASKDELCSQFRRILYAFFKEPIADRILKILRMASVRFNGFISGQCTEAVIISILFSVVLSVFRFPYAVMIGVTIGVFSLIPIVGSFIGMLIGILLTLMKSPMTMLWFVITYLIVQQIETNTIYPKVVGNSVGLPSIWVLFSVIVGGNAWGIIGMICMIPISSLVYALLRDGVAERLKKHPVSDEKLDPVPSEAMNQKGKGSIKENIQKVFKKNKKA